MNILYVSSSSSLQSGAELCMLKLAQHFNDGSYRSIIVTGKGEGQGRASNSLVDTVKIRPYLTPRPHRPASLWRLLGYVFSSTRAVLRLARLIREEDIDIVHVNELFDITGLIAGRLARVKTICHVRVILEEPRWLRALLVLIATLFSHRIICVSQAVQEKMFPKGRSSRKTVVIYDGGPDLETFDPTLYDRSSVRREFDLDSAEFVVGFVSKFTPNKGQDQLIKAAKQLNEEGITDIRYLLVGGAVPGHQAYHQLVKQLVNEYGLDDKFVFTGVRGDVPRLISACDVMVHIPVHHDPFPGVVLEAMAMEKPIIATRSGGIPEEFEDGISGILIPRRDPDRLAEAILSLYRNKDKRRRMGKAAREYLTTHFSLEKHFGQIEQLYNALLKEK